jgi:hypothetical protein
MIISDSLTYGEVFGVFENEFAGLVRSGLARLRDAKKASKSL